MSTRYWPARRSLWFLRWPISCWCAIHCPALSWWRASHDTPARPAGRRGRCGDRRYDGHRCRSGPARGTRGGGRARCRCLPEGVDVAAEELDITNESGVQEVINGVERLDILVNCAGVIRRGEEHQVCVFEKVLAANITGTRDVQSRASKTEGEQWLHHKHRVHAQLLRWRLGAQ